MPCSEIENILEAFIEGELSRPQKRALKDHLRSCPNCHRKWIQSVEILTALRSLPQETCPDHVVQTVLGQTTWTAKPKRLPETIRTILKPLYIPSWRLATGLGLMTLVVLTIIFSPYTQKQKEKPPAYSGKQIAQAKEEVQLAMGYVDLVFKKTQSTIEDEVIPAYVVKPLRESIRIVFKPITKGGQS